MSLAAASPPVSGVQTYLQSADGICAPEPTSTTYRSGPPVLKFDEVMVQHVRRHPSRVVVYSRDETHMLDGLPWVSWRLRGGFQTVATWGFSHRGWQAGPPAS